MSIEPKKPVIGIVPLWDAPRESLWMIPGYMDGVTEAGGLPVMLPLTENGASISQLAEMCSGFLFTGGHDVGPEVYGAQPSSLIGETCPARDHMETALLSEALRHDIPVLGICRGIQFLNAALGGSLWQDLPTERESAVDHHMAPPYDRVCHEVEILPDTPLAKLLGAGKLGVNSYHHQALKELAPGLSKMAEAPDGLTEAVWMPGKRFIWGVQWHPEFSHRVDEASRKIFSAFVSAAKKA